MERPTVQLEVPVITTEMRSGHVSSGIEVEGRIVLYIPLKSSDLNRHSKVRVLSF